MIAHTARHNDDGTTTVEARCIKTGSAYTVTVPTAGYWRWIAGELIQVAMPGISAEDREFLISGTSPLGWKMMFGDDEDDECLVHAVRQGAHFCACGADAVTCQRCGTTVCSGLAEWRAGVGNVGPCCAARPPKKGTCLCPDCELDCAPGKCTTCTGNHDAVVCSRCYGVGPSFDRIGHAAGCENRPRL